MKRFLPALKERLIPRRLPRRSVGAGSAGGTGGRRRSGLAAGAAALVLGGVLAGSLAGCSLGGDALVAESVNGHAISMTAYQQIVDLYKQQSSRSGQAVNWQSPEGRSTLASMQANALDFLSTTILLHQQVGEQHLSVTSKDLKTQLDALATNIKAAAQQSPDDPEFRALSQALKPATDEVAHNPDLNTLIAGRPSMADVLVIFATESADIQALSAHAKVPTAKVRLIEVNTQKDAEALRTQAEHGANFADLAKAHSLDAGSGQQGGDLGRPFFYVGQLSQLNPALDTAIFGPSASTAKTSYVIVPLDSSKTSKYILAEVTNRATTPLADLKDAQTQSSILSSWLDVVVKPAASIQQYVAVDPTPTPNSASQLQG